jgi:GABA permease
VIAISQLRMRRQREANGEAIAFKMWLFPGLTWATIVFIVGVLGVMAVRPDHRAEIVATALLSIGVVAAGLLVQRRRKAQGLGNGRVALDH